MNRFERWAVWSTSIATLVTGVVYLWMKYLLVSADPFAVVNHPWQPLVLKLHILVSPLLVFSIGLVSLRHVWRHLRSGTSDVVCDHRLVHRRVRSRRRAHLLNSASLRKAVRRSISAPGKAVASASCWVSCAHSETGVVPTRAAADTSARGWNGAQVDIQRVDPFSASLLEIR